jgi:tripartite-type tricarboxylate transporter receptor subunit TctC
MKRVLRILAAVAVLACLCAPDDALAQGFPNRPVRLIVPFPPGGATDIIARLLADKLGPMWGQNVVVDYKAGAGSVVGTDVVAKSAPDGYTIGIAITAFVINPSLRNDLPYDTIKDLAGVAMVSIAHIVIVATNSLPANNLAELIAYAKRNPGKINYASPGTGTSMHLAGELLKTMAGIDIVHVPYRGGATAYPDVIAGRIELQIEPLYAGLQNLKSKLVKPIAITSLQRAEMMPEIPTVAEVVPGFEVLSITGIIAPRATPRPIIEKLNADIGKVLQMADMRERMTGVGMEPKTMSADQFDAYIRSEIEKLTPIVKASGARAAD